MRRLGLALIALVLFAPVARAQNTFKIATLAPEGSSWMKLYHEWAQRIETDTSGRVKIKFYSGGVQGDERDAAIAQFRPEIRQIAGNRVPQADLA